MPELYGNQFKHEIRAERNALQSELTKERIAHRKTRDGLRMARAHIAELEAKMERMKQLVQGAIAEADKDVAEAAVKRYVQSTYTVSSKRALTEASSLLEAALPAAPL